MISQALTIARNAFVESLRQPALLFFTLASGVLQILVTWNTGYTLGLEESGELEGDNKLQFDLGLSTVFVCATILAAFIATATLSREIENKTALTIVSKPVGRATVVLGKYLGVSGALLISLATMILFLLLAVRHSVMSTASDIVDEPVIVFSVGAVLLALIAGGWFNFFYGWNFPQVVSVILLPFTLVAVACVGKFDKHWNLQDLAHDFKPQVTVAAFALTFAVLVLTSVAVAASTRLSQVMTVMVCLGVFVASLLTNHFLGRFAFVNTPVGIVTAAAPTDLARAAFSRTGDAYTIDLQHPPDEPIKPGQPIYYGVNANGFDLVAPVYAPFTGDLAKSEDLLGVNVPPAIIAVRAEGKSLTIRNIGSLTALGLKNPDGLAVPVSRPPRPGDFLFTAPTKHNLLALAPWAALPNMHYFWLLDAVSQNQPVPGTYLAVAAVYALCQVGIFLSLAVILFQKRDVG